jgi:glycosyltransferase involved in cell wall biosynthesis
LHLNILGIRGIPAAHGGFESFAAKFAPYMRDRGHSVLVYCQADAPNDGLSQWEDEWEGIHRVHFVPKRSGAVGTMEFDAACVRDVLKRPGVDLVLGYNTALFNSPERLRGRKIAMNMDGIEWKRDKWSLPAKVWFFLNEVAGANLCDVPICDHPEIAKHTARRSLRKPVMIPYGSDRIDDAPAELIAGLGIEPDGYCVSIARIEPENSILQIVEAFSARPRKMKLVVLGKFDPDNAYHNRVKAAAGDQVLFPGAIYDLPTVQALRYHARAYLHGHTVGGTNPSLVEALGAGNAVIAHDNRFNRWVAGAEQFYFGDAVSLENILASVDDGSAKLEQARAGARKRHAEAFRFDIIHEAYERVLIDLAERA